MSKKQTPTQTRLRLLELLEEARPYAERAVYREGILPKLAAKSDCIDGFLEVSGDWQKHIAPDAYELLGPFEGNLFDAMWEKEDASYVLGIAVGLLLRGPQEAALTPQGKGAVDLAVSALTSVDEPAAPAPDGQDDETAVPIHVPSVTERLEQVRNALTLICASSDRGDGEIASLELLPAIHATAAEAITALYWVETAAGKDFGQTPAPDDDQRAELEAAGMSGGH